MAYDAFLKLDGIEGESTKGAQGRDRDLVLQLGRRQLGLVLARWWRRRREGHVPGSIHFGMPMSKASPKLMSACATGKHIPSAVLTCRKAGGTQTEFLKIKLADVLVSSYQNGGNNSGPEADEFPQDQLQPRLRQDRLPLHRRSHRRDQRGRVRVRAEQKAERRARRGRRRRPGEDFTPTPSSPRRLRPPASPVRPDSCRAAWRCRAPGRRRA